MFDNTTLHNDSHKDLGLVLSEDLGWNNQYSYIIAHAYKTLGLIHQTFSSLHHPSIVLKLYESLATCVLYAVMASLPAEGY